MGGEGGGGSPIQLGLLSLVVREIIAATESGPAAKAALPADTTLLSADPSTLQTLQGINISGSQSEANAPARTGVGTSSGGGASGPSGSQGAETPGFTSQQISPSGGPQQISPPSQGIPELVPLQQGSPLSSTPTDTAGVSATNPRQLGSGTSLPSVNRPGRPIVSPATVGKLKDVAIRSVPALLRSGGSILAAKLNQPKVSKPKTAKSGASAARQRRADLAARRGFQSTVLTPLAGSSRARLGTPTLLGG